MTAVKVNQRRGFRVRLASSMLLASDKTRKSRELPFSWLNNTLYLSVNVLGSILLIEDTIFMSPTMHFTRLSGQERQYLHFSVILGPLVLVRLWGSKPWTPALQSSALPTKLVLPRLSALIILPKMLQAWGCAKENILGYLQGLKLAQKHLSFIIREICTF